MTVPNNGGDNPKWKPFLDVLPESLHGVIKPVLKEWDAGITQQFQEIHSQYEPLKKYQKLVDNNIDPDYVDQAIIFADEVQRNPKEVFDRVNETWKLGYVTPEQAAALQPKNEEDEFNFEDSSLEGLENHPQFKAMKQALDAVQQETQSRKEQEEQERQIQEFEDYLDDLESKTTESNLPFNRIFVTALMQQGMDGEAAVKQYHQVLAGNAVTQNGEGGTQTSEQDTNPPVNDAPVVLGGNGTGSGTPDNPVDFGSLSKNQLNATVEAIIQQQTQSGQ